MNIKLEREDIESAVRNIILSMIEPLPIYQKLEALDWILSIIEDIQDNVE